MERTDLASEMLRVSRTRGLLLGLALGDAIGTAPRSTGPLRAGVATQLVAFTVEGLIRASVRGAHKGICHPPSIVWHAYTRWAACQQITGRPTQFGDPDSDGWLAKVPAMSERRGNAPATVAALRHGELGTLEKPATMSVGAHAVVRTLPCALLGREELANPETLTLEVAALTHSPETAEVAALIARIARAIIETQAPRVDIGAVIQRFARDGEHNAAVISAATNVQRSPSHPATLARLAADHSASAAAAGGLYCAASFHAREDFERALRFAATAADAPSVCAVTGAVLGAAHGAEALPVELVSQLELAWVIDTLARDLRAEFSVKPSGGEYREGPDPHWWDRYPGW